MEPVPLCAVCRKPNELRDGTLFCGTRCRKVGDRIEARVYRRIGHRPKASSPGEWLALYRRFSEKGELMPFGS
ncbi:hypothetical protein STAL104432_16565 [Streptomyces albus]